MDEVLTPTPTVVTCKTKDCENKGVKLEVPLYPGGAVVCGPCGALLTA